MAKGAWSVIVYPDAADFTSMDAIVAAFAAAGADYSYILHDRDVKSDGTPKKPHYHLTLGWRKNWLDFGELSALCKSIGNVFAPLREQECIVHDAEACERYELHLDDESKAQYDASARVRSEKFYFRAYERKDDLREKARADKKKSAQSDLAVFMGQIMDIVREHELFDLAAVAQYCAAVPGFDMGMFWEQSVRVKAYCDSVRNMYYNDYKKRYEDKCAENSRLVREKIDSAKTYNEAHRQCMELAGQLYDCKRLLHSLAASGYDIAPAWWEIDLTAAEWERYFTNSGNEHKACEYKDGWNDD